MSEERQDEYTTQNSNEEEATKDYNDDIFVDEDEKKYTGTNNPNSWQNAYGNSNNNYSSDTHNANNWQNAYGNNNANNNANNTYGNNTYGNQNGSNPYGDNAYGNQYNQYQNNQYQNNGNPYVNNGPTVGPTGKKIGTGFGIASMVLGILALCTFCACINIPLAILAVIFGIIQLVAYEKKGFAIAGIITAVLSIILFVGCYTILASNPEFNDAVERSIEDGDFEDYLDEYEYYLEDDFQ